MKKIFWTVSALLALAGPAAATPVKSIGILSLDEAFAKAFNANDVEAVMALYADDAVSYSPGTMITRGKTEIRKGLAAMMGGGRISEFKLQGDGFKTCGNLGIQWGRWSMTMTPKNGAPPQHLEGRFMDVAQEFDGKWLYVADQASSPLPPPPGMGQPGPGDPPRGAPPGGPGRPAGGHGPEGPRGGK